MTRPTRRTPGLRGSDHARRQAPGSPPFPTGRAARVSPPGPINPDVPGNRPQRPRVPPATVPGPRNWPDGAFRIFGWRPGTPPAASTRWSCASPVAGAVACEPAARAPSVAARPLRTLCVTGRDPGSSRLASRQLRACRVRVLFRRSCRAESDKAPPCMRWRGLARPRRTGWSVARPCRRRAPPAGARYPCERPVSRLLPRSRGRPQVVPVSER